MKYLHVCVKYSHVYSRSDKYTELFFITFHSEVSLRRSVPVRKKRYFADCFAIMRTESGGILCVTREHSETAAQYHHVLKQYLFHLIVKSLMKSFLSHLHVRKMKILIFSTHCGACQYFLNHILANFYTV